MKIYYFGDQTLNFNYGLNSCIFWKVNRPFQKMDKKNVQNQKPKTLFDSKKLTNLTNYII
jgi:hypothetical protein